MTLYAGFITFQCERCQSKHTKTTFEHVINLNGIKAFRRANEIIATKNKNAKQKNNGKINENETNEVQQLLLLLLRDMNEKTSLNMHFI